MKHLMQRFGVDPLVIPNGIPADLLQPVPEKQIGRLRTALGVGARTIFLFKAGRFDPAKQWITAVEASARLRELGYHVVFPLRGGIEPHGGEVLRYGRERGLRVKDVAGTPASWDDVLTQLRAAGPADLYNLQFFLPQSWLRPFYAAADAVLAMSGHEPFGLVGLEAMAAGGLVFTGATGEEYTMGGQAAVVLDTHGAEEIVIRLLDLRAQPDRIRLIRQAARRRAAYATWDRAVDVLLDHVSFIAQAAGAIPPVSRPHPEPIRSGGRL
jgi:glycosyltransferase involved in cell wall biosynthesis